MSRRCPGCGAPLQSEDEARAGFVPGEVLSQRGREAVCRRCFRLRHYGQGNPGPVREALAAALRAAGRCRAAVLVLDAVDFEGSLHPELAGATRAPLVVVNKVDLLPPTVPPDEVAAWAGERLAALGIGFREVFAISAARGWGTRGLWEAMAAAAGRGGRVALLGATNTGKSTLLNRWLVAAGARPAATVSPVAGTTLAAAGYRPPGAPLTVVDTPGVLPPGRLVDLLCPACAARLIPARPLSARLLQWGPQDAVLCGGLAWVEREPAGDPAPVLAYGPAGVVFHRTRAARAATLVAQGPDWLGPPCPACRRALAGRGFAEHRVVLASGQDLALWGLGWLSGRGAAVGAVLRLPRGAAYSLRPNLVGRKDRRSPAPARPGRRSPT